MSKGAKVCNSDKWLTRTKLGAGKSLQFAGERVSRGDLQHCFCPCVSHSGPVLLAASASGHWPTCSELAEPGHSPSIDSETQLANPMQHCRGILQKTGCFGVLINRALDRQETAAQLVHQSYVNNVTTNRAKSVLLKRVPQQTVIKTVAKEVILLFCYQTI